MVSPSTRYASTERKAAHDATPHAAFGGNVAEQRAGGREGGEQLHGALHGRIEAPTAPGPLPFVSVNGRLEFRTRGRRELDELHDRFCS